MPSSCGEVATSTDVAAPCSIVLNVYMPESTMLARSSGSMWRDRLVGMIAPWGTAVAGGAAGWGVGAAAVAAPAPPRLHHEQHVRGLRLPVRQPGVVWPGREVDVLE